MYRHPTLWLAVAVCVSATPTLVAQKGGKPKPADQSATASFRCAGLASDPPCGASDAVVPDSITGDGGPYVGTGTVISGSGAFLRADGEFVLELRSGGGRTIHLSFAEQVAPPSGTFFERRSRTRRSSRSTSTATSSIRRPERMPPERCSRSPSDRRGPRESKPSGPTRTAWSIRFASTLGTIPDRLMCG